MRILGQSNYLKRICHFYRIRLFGLNYDDIQQVDSKVQVSFKVINETNLYFVKELREDGFYIHDFKSMLNMGDYGVYIIVNNRFVGYGWGKQEGSADYFFQIKHGYLCRFYVHPDFRGLNIYPKTILHLIDQMNNYRIKQYYIACDPDNYASINGLIKIGFKRIIDLNFIRVLGITLNKYKLT